MYRRRDEKAKKCLPFSIIGRNNISNIMANKRRWNMDITIHNGSHSTNNSINNYKSKKEKINIKEIEPKVL